LIEQVLELLVAGAPGRDKPGRIGDIEAVWVRKNGVEFGAAEGVSRLRCYTRIV
jgi:hypothetical protein